MCIPRVDPAAWCRWTIPLCPQKNRREKQAKYMMTLTMDPRGVTAASADQPTPSDPTVFAPFEVGDYVTYAGTLMTIATAVYTFPHTQSSEMLEFIPRR